MVRLFAKEASAAIGVILAEGRGRPRRAGALAGPLQIDGGRPMFHEQSS